MDISRLRRETAGDHEAVEGVMPLMVQELDTNEYVACISRMYGVVAAWEEQAYRTAPDWLRDSLAERKRLGMLDSDLAYFGHVSSEERSTLPQTNDVPSLLGAMYVMEGSTLGGQQIARHVEKCMGLTTGFGNAYFVGHGDQTGRMWKEFCLMLETRVPEDDARAVVQGAKAMFATFGEWMRRNEVKNGS